MKKRNIQLLLGVLLLGLIALFLVMFNSKSGTLKGANKNFAINDTASVTKIFLADKLDNQVLLTKNSDGIWMVNETHIANSDNINLLLFTMEHLAVWAPIPKSAHDNIIKRLAVVSTKVEIYQKKYFIDFWGIKLFEREILTKTYFVGDPTMTSDGNTMLLEGASQAFIVYLPGFRGFVSPRYSPYESDWRDHTVFKTRLPQIQEIKHENILEPEESFLVTKSGSRTFQLTHLASGKIVPDYDTVTVFDHVSAFRSIKYEAIAKNLNQNYLDSLSFYHFYTLTLTDVDGKVTVAKMYHQPELLITDYKKTTEEIEESHNLDKFYLKLNDEPQLYVAQFFVFDRLIQPLSFYLKTNYKK
ncbi:MAG: hypothetical protein PHI36_06620 [Bacteroidales bacterium]|nr:hypothetical protein [Bacteroidales bacterium]